MSDIKHMLVLANSARDGKHCVAGKIATIRTDGKFEIAKEWIRLNCPGDPEGAVPYSHTVCQNHGSIRPFDIVKVHLQQPCNNSDHPEDWDYDPTKPLEFAGRATPSVLSDLVDTPQSIWADGSGNNSVRAGFVSEMGSRAATLYLIKAPPGWEFRYWKETNPRGPYPATKRRLRFKYAGTHHDFSVTDADFLRRYKVWDKMKLDNEQTLQIPNPLGAYFCLSLTKLTPDFSRAHYKICATIFETDA